VERDATAAALSERAAEFQRLKVEGVRECAELLVAALARQANTLDAMWGYRNARYSPFSWAEARLTTLSCALRLVTGVLTPTALLAVPRRAVEKPECRAGNGGGCGQSRRVARRTGVLSRRYAGAAAIGERLDTRTGDIERALRLIQHTVLLWVLTLFSGGWLVDYAIPA
jgi:hypothetical protein